MEQELKIINKLGVVTSSELQDLIDKNIRTIIRNLNRLWACGDIEVLVFKNDKFRRRLYLDGKVYNNLIKVKRS